MKKNEEKTPNFIEVEKELYASLLDLAGLPVPAEFRLKLTPPRGFYRDGVEYMRVREVCNFLEVTTSRLRQWVKRGDITSYIQPITRHRVFRKDQVEALQLNRIKKREKSRSTKIDTGLKEYMDHQ